MITPEKPAIVLAPMDGLTDAPMRAVQGEIGAFTYSVAEFVRVSATVLPRSMFVRDIPELLDGAQTPSGMPVHVQILGGHPGRMAASAQVAINSGATAIDINFGCPAPTVNNHDGGAALLRHPQRIQEIVAAVREAVPTGIPVSAKLRLGWENVDDIFENAERAAAGGASWLTIHARTRRQGYQPPVSWHHIGRVREQVNIPVVANGDIWTIEAFRRCREETGCQHFMLGRGALADPSLTHRIAVELGIGPGDRLPRSPFDGLPYDWRPHLQRLVGHSSLLPSRGQSYMVQRIKQWLRIANFCGSFAAFDAVKRLETVEEMFGALGRLCDGDEIESRPYLRPSASPSSMIK